MKKLIVLAAVVLGAVWMLRGESSDKTDDNAVHDGHNHVVNRAWIEKIPKDMRDKIDVFIAQSDPQFGAFQRTSAYEGSYSVFQWHGGGSGKYHVTMLQSGKKHDMKASVSRKNCKEFDLCMTLNGAPRGTTKYYSMKDWVIDGKATQENIRAFIRTKLLKAGAK